MSKQGKAELVGIEEANVLIAEFMGAELKTTEDSFVEGKINKWVVFREHPNQLIKHVGRTFKDDDLKYDLSWDWLMPVVERIAGGISSRIFDIDYELLREEESIKIMRIHIYASIDTVWREVVGFIQWHNQQSLTP